MTEQLNYEREADHLMDAWDAMPRGPAIFIATCEGDRPIYGTWVSLNQPEPYFFAELDLLLNEPEAQQREREWVVLDQIEVGETMLPERLSLAGLHRIFADRRSGGTR